MILPVTAAGQPVTAVCLQLYCDGQRSSVLGLVESLEVDSDVSVLVVLTARPSSIQSEDLSLRTALEDTDTPGGHLAKYDV